MTDDDKKTLFLVDDRVETFAIRMMQRVYPSPITLAGRFFTIGIRLGRKIGIPYRWMRHSLDMIEREENGEKIDITKEMMEELLRLVQEEN